MSGRPVRLATRKRRMRSARLLMPSLSGEFLRTGLARCAAPNCARWMQDRCKVKITFRETAFRQLNFKFKIHFVNTVSYWRKTSSLPRFPALDRNLTVDAVVIGAGITGVTAAYLLKQRGLSVALLEREHCCSGDTGQTTAHLTCQPDAGLSQIARDFDRETAGAVWRAGAAAIFQISELVRTLHIDCGFQWVPGILHAATPEDETWLKEEAALASALDIVCDYRSVVPFFDHPGVVFPNQAKFHPLLYLTALLERIPGEGCHVFEQSAVEEIDDDPIRVRTARGRIRCKHLIVATHNPLMGITGKVKALLFQTKLALYTSYVVGAKLPRGFLSDALFWDTAEPYHYLRIENRNEHDYAIFGGCDHKTGQVLDTPGIYRELEAELHRFAPQAEVDARWSGQVIETNDGLPFIGTIADHQFVATGFAGNGMTFGTLSAMMAVDSVSGRKNRWAELFDPNRTKIRGGTWSYIEENKDYPVHLFCGWLAGTDRRTPEELNSDEGAILRINGQRAAVYKDKDGQLCACSAVCTHLQCIVGWNAAEKTWDCPCHGSRFHPTGEVMSGPAEQPLEKIDVANAKVEQFR